MFLRARAELRRWRTDLEAERVRIKAPALGRCKAIDTEARRISDALSALEDPIDAQIKAKVRAEEARKEAEAARDAALRAKLDKLRGLPLAWIGRTAADLSGVIEQIARYTPEATTAEFGDLSVEAGDVIAATLGKLRQMHAATTAAESERAEMARLKAAETERERTEQARIAAEVERVNQARIAEESRIRAAESESRRAIETQERQARERIEAEERKARAEREKADEAARQIRLAEQARLDVERQRIAEASRAAQAAIDAKAREEARVYAEHVDARAMLALFVERHGDKAEFAKVTKAIRAHLTVSKQNGDSANV